MTVLVFLIETLYVVYFSACK